MNGHAFDRMARFWGTSTDRRRTLRLIGAGVIAGTGIGRGKSAAAQTSVAQMACTQDAECQDGDGDPCTGGLCQEGFCTFFIVSCIEGTTCCGNGECCPVGESGGCLADTDCSPASDDPCEGVRCETGTCVPFLVTCGPDFSCCGNGVCCPLAGGCVVDSDCPTFPSPWDTGPRCVSGVCVPSSAPA